MSEKTSVWDLFNNPAEFYEEEQQQSYSNSKRIKASNAKNEIAWLKGLLHPSAAKQFVKFRVKEVISTSNQHIICKIEPNDMSQLDEFNSLIGFFNVWWWREWLDKLDFTTIQDLTTSFPFLARIRNRNEPLILPKSLETEPLDFYLLVNDLKTVPNENNPRIGLVTSRRFLVIDWGEDD